MDRRIIGIDWGADGDMSVAIYAHVTSDGMIYVDHEVVLDPATRRPERQLGSTADGALVPDAIFGPGHRAKHSR